MFGLVAVASVIPLYLGGRIHAITRESSGTVQNGTKRRSINDIPTLFDRSVQYLGPRDGSLTNGALQPMVHEDTTRSIRSTDDGFLPVHDLPAPLRDASSSSTSKVTARGYAIPYVFPVYDRPGVRNTTNQKGENWGLAHALGSPPCHPPEPDGEPVSGLNQMNIESKNIVYSMEPPYGNVRAGRASSMKTVDVIPQVAPTRPHRQHVLRRRKLREIWGGISSIFDKIIATNGLF